MFWRSVESGGPARQRSGRGAAAGGGARSASGSGGDEIGAGGGAGEGSSAAQRERSTRTAAQLARVLQQAEAEEALRLPARLTPMQARLIRLPSLMPLCMLLLSVPSQGLCSFLARVDGNQGSCMQFV
jgi:hypothetical protein